ncbi:hypothetical protein CPB83DRAFT_834816 [Crepidotus variabilis]|uniref:BZIP domain-containing protein n=1 Tax=Crepidotus variabilis TaxID=179855 RepID=A0A9P6EIE1_9AGAR|nr:hypothetical protein CPB83DRAFT_834816 [Crepidotus variabilis]
MSQIIAADAPLLSPLSQSCNWEPSSPTHDSFTYAYYNLPSPPLSDIQSSNSPLLRMRTLDSEPVCLPTHQVFDFPEVQRPLTPPSRSPSVSAQAAAISAAAAIMDSAALFGGLSALNAISADSSGGSSCGSKRSASPGPPVAKKRAVGERVASKDFIPPDVSGLTKREARLVKNRAAAFLSRQRKREEFETMEIRVAELEQENKRLLALAQNGSNASDSAAVHPEDPSSSQQGDNNALSEVELLKAQLAAAQERERTLSAQLASQQNTVSAPTTAPALSGPSIKLESTDSEPQFSLASSLVSSPARSTVAVPSAHKSSASLGLMVLLCALPSLLSMRMQSPTANNFAITNPFRASSNPSNSYFVPNDYEWSKPDDTSGSLMDLDNDSSHGARIGGTRKLEFTGLDGVDDLGLGDLDISFDTAPSDDGKIRVRIHPNGSGSASSSQQVSRSSSRQVSRGATPIVDEDSSMSGFGTQTTMAMASSSSLAPRALGLDTLSSGGASPLTTSSSDPFLGVMSGDSDMDFGLGMGLGLGSLDGMGGPFGSDGSFYSTHGSKFGDLGLVSPLSEGSAFFSECTTGTGTEAGKRRVRIALKSMPQEGGEGGEWEVQIC